jgi:hypothetical protein
VYPTPAVKVTNPKSKNWAERVPKPAEFGKNNTVSKTVIKKCNI